jgi:hypothetical protein
MHLVHRKTSLFFAVAAVAFAALCKAAGDPASATSATPKPAAPRPSVALLLPLDAPDFAPPAEAVLAGCKAALALVEDKPSLQVVRTDASSGHIMAGYETAVTRRRCHRRANDTQRRDRAGVEWKGSLTYPCPECTRATRGDARKPVRFRPVD